MEPGRDDAVERDAPCFPLDAIILNEHDQQLIFACLDDCRMRINDTETYARISSVMRLMTGRY